MASTSGSSEMSLRKFDGSNFNFWKEQMKHYLIIKRQIDPIKNEDPPEGYKPIEWQNLDRIVRAIIRMHLSESVYFRVQSCLTTFQLWKTLLDTYEKKSCCHEDILDSAPLQSLDEGIRLGPGTPK